MARGLDPVREYNLTRSPEERVSFCHAPSINLNFEQNGNVTACCYNRTFVLGTYPHDSIEEIWKGPKIGELRDALRNFDLSKGCNLCREQLDSANYQGLRARHFDGPSLNRRAGSGPGGDPLATMPTILEFEISNICNLECTMCSGNFSSLIRRNRERLPPLPRVYDHGFVDQIRPFLIQAEWTRFLGGEPFLNPLYFPMWEILIAAGGGKCAITSNGTILDDRVKDVLERLKPHLVVSIDSVNRANYERIRKNASFDLLLRNVEYFRAYAQRCHRELHVAVCPTQENWKDLPTLMQFCDFYGLTVAFNTVLWPLELSLKTLPPDELRRIHRHLSKTSPRKNAAQYKDLLSQIRAWS